MATKPKAGGASFERRDPIPAGNHIGICVSLIEIGTVQDEYQGEQKEAFKINVTFELPLVLMDFEENGQVIKKPAVISQMYTLSAHEKSKLRQTVEAWGSRKYTDEEFREFDLSQLLGAPALINVMHTLKSGIVYANIGSVTSVLQGMPVPPHFNPIKYLQYDSWDESLFTSQPKFIREMIAKTPEYAKLKGLAQPQVQQQYRQPQQQGFGQQPQQQYQQPAPQQFGQQPQQQYQQPAPAQYQQPQQFAQPHPQVQQQPAPGFGQQAAQVVNTGNFGQPQPPQYQQPQAQVQPQPQQYAPVTQQHIAQANTGYGQQQPAPSNVGHWSPAPAPIGGPDDLPF